MSESESTNKVTSSTGDDHKGRKPYQKPDLRYERVFETMALACGKTQTTQDQCAHNRKNS